MIYIFPKRLAFSYCINNIYRYNIKIDNRTNTGLNTGLNTDPNTDLNTDLNTDPNTDPNKLKKYQNMVFF